jgi:GNAT superfamily N-acetyltransferase
MQRARRLYEAYLDEAERIPWQWIEEAVASRVKWRPGRWCPHLLLSANRRKSGGPGPATGFAYGIHLPNYGGYACYLAVDPRNRGRGTGTRLLEVLIRVLQLDATCEGVSLPFVVLESHDPRSTASTEADALWQARLRLFRRVGARHIDGLTFLAPNFNRRRGPPVPLDLFLIPVDKPAESFDEAALRGVAAGLLEHIYGRSEQDPLYQQTLHSDARPRLKTWP